ncbi:MAG TPA: hypothetical protein VHP11_04310 [Tepidisphaeraceae bacterium]|nr:hypothetical protein [Tepidisphaeraceae bacterium]
MTHRYSHVDEQRLADALKDEASRHAPAYSDLLHARIMRQIASADRIPQSSYRISWRWIPLAAAAAILLALWIGQTQWMHPGSQVPSPRTIAQDTPPAFPAVDELWERTASSAYARLETKLKEGQLAYLDDDARRLAHFVLDCTTPSLPREKR